MQQKQLLQAFQKKLILGLIVIFHHQRFYKKSSVLKEASKPLPTNAKLGEATVGIREAKEETKEILKSIKTKLIKNKHYARVKIQVRYESSKAVIL